eukprot:scaffold3334_cov369-Prasinococcus_capsulatus_cf.AAC.18
MAARGQLRSGVRGRDNRGHAQVSITPAGARWYLYVRRGGTVRPRLIGWWGGTLSHCVWPRVTRPPGGGGALTVQRCTVVRLDAGARPAPGRKVGAARGWTPNLHHDGATRTAASRRPGAS